MTLFAGRRLQKVISVLFASGLMMLASASASAETVYFDHDNERYLYPSQHQGGAAPVPVERHDAALPLVVFLHGTNLARALHFWLGGGGRDLRPLTERLFQSKRVRPFIFAGPSQTRAAGHGRNLWTHFDLDRFVEDVSRALDGRATVDDEAVTLVSHSEAGCNVRGGLASAFLSRGYAVPRALISIDPCLDADLGRAFSRREPS